MQGARPETLEAQAVFERPEDRFDALADPGQRRSVVRFVAAGGAQDRRAEALLGVGFEVAAGVALVGDDQFAAVQPALKQSQRDVAFFLIG